MIRGELVFTDGVEHFPVKIQPGMNVFQAVQRIALLPMEATFVGFDPTETDHIRTVGSGVLQIDMNEATMSFPEETPPRKEYLTAVELGIMDILAENPGVLVTFKDLVEPATQCMTVESLRTHINNLRRKLGTTTAHITNARSRGYILELKENSDLSTEIE